MFFGKIGVLFFLKTPVLRFALLPYYPRYVGNSPNWKSWCVPKFEDSDREMCTSEKDFRLNLHFLLCTGSSFRLIESAERWFHVRCFTKDTTNVLHQALTGINEISKTMLHPGYLSELPDKIYRDHLLQVVLWQLLYIHWTAFEQPKHCVKSVQIWNYFLSQIFLYSVQMQKNKDHKKLSIRTPFT